MSLKEQNKGNVRTRSQTQVEQHLAKCKAEEMNEELLIAIFRASMKVSMEAIQAELERYRETRRRKMQLQLESLSEAIQAEKSEEVRLEDARCNCSWNHCHRCLPLWFKQYRQISPLFRMRKLQLRKLRSRLSSLRMAWISMHTSKPSSEMPLKKKLESCYMGSYNPGFSEGKAAEAAAIVPTADISDYEHVKESILRRFRVTSESYRQLFRTKQKKAHL
ncbi:hypothetical protein QYM36_013898 [Artemia franciscana]|uniref:Uncharacterized protein n=1 Tax=Artemia franciscana TaxID=6661 RepID=A0AA88KZP4_ARTSF|nr:hypothetical protein QYM36_013898 [Artemia franciscana]